MSLENLLTRLENRGTVTPVTPKKSHGVTVKSAQLMRCTPVTPVTPQKTTVAEELLDRLENRQSGTPVTPATRNGVRPKPAPHKRSSPETPETPKNVEAEEKLKSGDEQRINAWLDAIGEDDEAMRREVLSKCRSDPKALAYVLAQANPINARQAET